jgi:hypothetical protein
MFTREHDRIHIVMLSRFCVRVEPNRNAPNWHRGSPAYARTGSG